MKILSKRVLLVALLILASVAFCFSQGLYWESKTTGAGQDENAKVSKAYCNPDMFKQVGGTGDRTIIIRLDKKMIFTVQDEAKTYSEVSFDDLKKAMSQLGSKMSAAMKQMQERMKDMPEEQRKQMEKMMGESMLSPAGEPKVEVTPTGESKTISGYSCKGYLMKNGPREMMKIWTTESVGGSDLLKKNLRELSSLFASLNPTHGNAMAEGMKKIQGFPIETEMMGTVTTVTKVEKRSIPASEFDVPAGYTRVQSEFMKGLDEKD